MPKWSILKTAANGDDAFECLDLTRVFVKEDDDGACTFPLLVKSYVPTVLLLLLPVVLSFALALLDSTASDFCSFESGRCSISSLDFKCIRRGKNERRP